MTYDYILKKVTTMVSDQLGLDDADCGPHKVLGDDLGADSLDHVSIVLDIETELGIEIPEDDTETARTVGDLASITARALGVEVPA